MVAEKIVLILFAHFIADSALQPERHALKKGKILRYMLTHCLIYAGVMSFVLQYLSMFNIWKSMFLLISHLIIDTVLSNSKDTEKAGWIGYLDQGLHLICLGVIL